MKKIHNKIEILQILIGEFSRPVITKMMGFRLIGKQYYGARGNYETKGYYLLKSKRENYFITRYINGLYLRDRLYIHKEKGRCWFTRGSIYYLDNHVALFYTENKCAIIHTNRAKKYLLKQLRLYINDFISVIKLHKYKTQPIK